MSVNFSCPISGDQRDNNTVRIVAGLTLAIATVTLIVAQAVGPRAAAIIATLLAIDFIIRAFIKPKYSPLATAARGISSGLNVPKKMVDGAPKVFAARIGVLFSVVSALLFALGLTIAGSVVITVLMVCAFLESVLGFCVGCWVYSLLPQGAQRVVSKNLIAG